MDFEMRPDWPMALRRPVGGHRLLPTSLLKPLPLASSSRLDRAGLSSETACCRHEQRRAGLSCEGDHNDHRPA